MQPAAHDTERRGPLLAAGAFLTGFGALTVLLVLLSIMQPAVLVGALILGASGVQIFQAVRGPELWSRIWHGALGAVYLIAAIVLFFRPETQRTGLWLALAAFFLADGGLRLFLGYRRSRPKDVLWLIASGVGSVAIALLIYFGLPSTASGWQVGMLVGFALFAGGGFLIWIARGPLPEPAVVVPEPVAASPPAVEPPIEDPV